MIKSNLGNLRTSLDGQFFKSVKFHIELEILNKLKTTFEPRQNCTDITLFWLIRYKHFCGFRWFSNQPNYDYKLPWSSTNYHKQTRTSTKFTDSKICTSFSNPKTRTQRTFILSFSPRLNHIATLPNQMPSTPYE
jgi:hypothetical protein